MPKNTRKSAHKGTSGRAPSTPRKAPTAAAGGKRPPESKPAEAAKPGRGGKREGAGRPKLPRHHAEYAAAAGATGTVADVPQDPLAVISWAGRAMALSMYKAMTDPNVDERTRRHEMRQIAKSLALLVPAERLEAAERTIREAQEVMGQDRKDPEMTPDAPSSTQPTRSLRLDS